MWIFDPLLLIAVSTFLATKNHYLGIVTFFLGVFVEFQNKRHLFLLGEQKKVISTGRKIKAAILSLVLGGCLIPFALPSAATSTQFEKTFNLDTLLPLVIIVGLLSSVLMAALSTEKRSR